LESQPFIPTPSNDIEVRDVPIPKLILEEGKNTSLTPKDAFYNLFGAFDKGNIS
jgi:hypothetical protein